MGIEVAHKVTKANFKTFLVEARKWIEILGLTDWEVDVKLDDEDNDITNEAWCSYDMKGRRATLALNLFQPRKLSEFDCKLAAFHEVLHLLLARLSVFAKNDHIDELYIDEENHAIIARLVYAAYFSKSPLSQ